MSDSNFNFVNDIFCQIVDKKKAFGESSLTEAEHVVLWVWHASGIIENGGFQYFFEQQLDVETVAVAYQKIGAGKCAELLRLSLSLFPEPILHADWMERIKYAEDNSDRFENLSRAFWREDKKTEVRLAAYVHDYRDKILGGA